MPERPKVSRLPDDVRTWLDGELIRRGFGGYEELESLLEQRGYEIGKSALHRYGQKLERKLAAIRASTEAARSIAEAAPDDADLRSAAVMSLVQTEIFEVLVNLQEATEEDIDPVTRVKLLNQAAKNIATLSRASVNQKKWALALREKIGVKLGALEADAKAGKRKLDLETLRQVREGLYGIAA